jgi:hypothetical protein
LGCEETRLRVGGSEVKESEAVGREGWVGWWKEGEGG